MKAFSVTGKWGIMMESEKLGMFCANFDGCSQTHTQHITIFSCATSDVVVAGNS